jgi:hypothetical protein
VAYITGSHDERRDPEMSREELEYVARMDPEWTAREAVVHITRASGAAAPAVAGDALAYVGRHEPGRKTDLECGRVPLVGFGVLAGLSGDEENLVARFEWECVPYDRRAKAGYKSFTLTVPKEVSLYAEGHRQRAKEAIYEAVAATVEDTFVGLDVSAVGAVHTRNEAGEVHFHVHLLVAKFARNRANGRHVSVNSKAGGNTGRRIWDLKRAWKAHLDRVLKERFEIEVEQQSRHGSVAIRLRNGTRVGALNRDSRRVLEKMVQTGQPGADLHDGGRRRVVKLGAMDDRIYEVAAGASGQSGWDAGAFVELFPEQAKYVGRYQKRVVTLKQAGYLTVDGGITPHFRVHYGLRRGEHAPELEGLRLDLAREAQIASEARQSPVPVPSLLKAADRDERVRRRVERLGYSREEVVQVDDQWRARRPTQEQLRSIRAEIERRVTLAPARLPRTKSTTRAFVDVQLAKVRWAVAISAGILTRDLGEKKRIADAMFRAARAHLFYARERRLAVVGRRLQRWFWAIRVAMPRDVRRLELAIERCDRLARSQEVQRLYRAAVREALDHGRDPSNAPPDEARGGVLFGLDLAGPEVARLRLEAERGVDRRGQVPAPPPVRSERHPIPTAPHPDETREREPRADAPTRRQPAGDPSPPVRWLLIGRELLAAYRPEIADNLERWRGREADLVAQLDRPKGGAIGAATEGERTTAMRAQRAGWLLERAQGLRRHLTLPPVFEEDRSALERITSRLEALGLGSVFTPEVLVGVAPLQVQKALDQYRHADLLGADAQWTLREKAAREVTDDVVKRFGRELDRGVDR